MKESPAVLTQMEGAVATLCINLPHKHNFLTLPCLQALEGAMVDLAGDPAVRVVVLRGAGERAFCAGYDIRALPRAQEDFADGAAGETLPLEKALQTIEGFPYPVIAMLNGDAYGGGCELAMACDIRIAAERVRMGMPPARLGLVYPYPGYRRFLRVLGFARTLEIFLTAGVYKSHECLQMGLVNHVVPDEDLEPFTRRFAAGMARNAPLSLKGTKRVLMAVAGSSPLAAAEERELHALFHDSLNSRDAAEGIAAFTEKRPPVFTGA